MKCKYCEGNTKMKSTEIDDLNIRIDENLLIIDYEAYSLDSSFRTLFKINYCPMCGKELRQLEN